LIFVHRDFAISVPQHGQNSGQLSKRVLSVPATSQKPLDAARVVCLIGLCAALARLSSDGRSFFVSSYKAAALLKANQKRVSRSDSGRAP